MKKKRLDRLALTQDHWPCLSAVVSAWQKLAMTYSSYRCSVSWLTALAQQVYICIRRHGSDVYLGMPPIQNGGSYLMY